MAPIDRIPFSHPPIDAEFWPQLARRTAAWARAAGVALRDAVLLVPYAQLLAPARRAFAAHGGWQPRIETTETLRASLAPAPSPQPGQLRFDNASDRLVATALLRGQRWAAAWAEHDPHGFADAVAALIETAHGFARAAAAHAPAQRDGYWTAARERLAPVHGPGSDERMLARIALEWAAASDGASTDALFEQVPAAWIAVQAGGADALTTRLLQHAARPALLIDTDPPPDAPFEPAAALDAPSIVRCDTLEREALATAASVIDAVARGATPVALIANDRVLVRRTRALLERAGVALRDETGWKLSTTRAAARVMALLRAADPRAGRDAWLDWLKGDPLGEREAVAVTALERSWRRRAPPPPFADALLQQATARLAPLAARGPQSLAAWLERLAAALRDAVGPLDADPAGRQVLAALHVGDRGDAAWQQLAADTRFDLAGFTAWVDDALEQASFVAPDDGDAAVIVTPMARAMLRPFGAVVCPGCDERRLGAPPPPHPLLGDTVARELALVDAEGARRRETLAFAQLLRAPQVTLLHRAGDVDEPLAPSPLLERASLTRRRRGAAPPATRDATVPVRRVRFDGVERPAPSAVGALPETLSASAIDALRDCPYRFFARSVLGLGEAAELDAELEKRDYGSWLHAVLHRFHGARGDAPTPADDVQHLLGTAEALQHELALDAAQLLPYRATLERLAPRYVDWLHAREARGWRFDDGEIERSVTPRALGGTVLRGRIDRVDRRAGALELIDYKTGASAELRRKTSQPLEDTQLAVYAALVDDGADLQAMYLALDDAEGPTEVPHPDVQASARALLEGLGADLAQLRAGAGLPALGEGRVCDFCEARGLCRRDHWKP